MTEAPPPPPALQDDESILRIADVCQRIGVGKSTVYRWVKAKSEFPRPVQIGEAAFGWYASEITAWIASRPRA